MSGNHRDMPPAMSATRDVLYTRRLGMQTLATFAFWARLSVLLCWWSGEIVGPQSGRDIAEYVVACGRVWRGLPRLVDCRLRNP